MMTMLRYFSARFLSLQVFNLESGINEYKRITPGEEVQKL